MTGRSRRQPNAMELSLRGFEMTSGGDLDHLNEVFAEDFIMEWPQSHERVLGGANTRAIIENYPGGLEDEGEMRFAPGGEEEFALSPMFTVIRLEGSGDTATSVVKMRYPDGSDWFSVSIATARDGRIVRLVEYFAPMYKAPEWRSQWVARMEDDAQAADATRPTSEAGGRASLPAGQPSAQDLTRRMFELLKDARYERLDEVYDDGLIVEWPQSRERVLGAADMRAILEAYPGGAQRPFAEGMHFIGSAEKRSSLPPTFTMIETRSSGDTATSVVKTRYPDGSDWCVVTIARARAGKLVHLVQYFAPVIEPPEWRAQWVEYTEAP